MSGPPRIRSSNITDGRVLLPYKIKNSKPVRKANEAEAVLELKFTEVNDNEDDQNKKKMAPPNPASRFSPPTMLSSSRVLRRRKEELMGLSLSVSCSSNCSSKTFRGRSASTEGMRSVKKDGRKRQQSLPRPGGIAVRSPEIFQGKIRCPWITPNSDTGYVAFHDEEWGVPVHEDRKLFELLVLSGALAELTWPAILNKRHEFREVFLDFDPKEVSKLDEETFTSSLLSEPKIRAVIGNSRQILKIVEDFGSFDRYCWSFVKNKPIVGKFRYSRQVPVKTSKAEVISKDLMRRGFRCVGPTITYSFMQVAGITNDHLTCCYRFEQCCSVAPNNHIKEKISPNPITNNSISPVLDLPMDFGDLNLL